MSNTFQPPGPLNTPVLFLVFNRPDVTRKVFKAIRQAKPHRLYVAADGPRHNKGDEANKIEEVRDISMAVDWDCKVKTLFREKNLGCKIAVSSAINWFFENEPEGIILEDDCLPSHSFFWFCQELLEKYRHDSRAMMIGGSNFLPENQAIKTDYFFSRYFSIWGWATWRRAWKYYDIEMSAWKSIKKTCQIEGLYTQRYFKDHMIRAFDNVVAGKVNTWDYQWFFTCLFNHGLSIVPHVNMISNIGVVGTHAGFVSKSQLLPIVDMDNIYDMRHPEYVCPDYHYDNLYIKEYFGSVSQTSWRTLLRDKLCHYVKGLIC